MEERHPKEYGPLVLALFSFATGIVAGCGAYLFRLLIALIHNLLFYATLSLSYDANSHAAPSIWGGLVALAPVVGAVGVVFLVRNFAPEAKGHGVPEVMDAIYYKRGIIRPMVAVVKSLASAICIGSGGSVGREGPIAQIGSAFGSTLGQVARMGPWQCNVLVAAGAGAGIAATFNTPIGGLLFATEILLYEVSVRTLVPVVIATATATYLGQLFFGIYPAFTIPDIQSLYYHIDRPPVLAAYVGLGTAMGIVSTLFIRTIYGFEDLFERRIPGNDYLRHLSGMLVVGLMFTVLQRFSGHYHIEGVGYATIQDILTASMHGAGFLLLLLLLKLLATGLTIGSGGSGGIFSPSLFIGATFGGAYGILLNHLFPGLAVSPPAFAVAGMAASVGGATGAALTAIVMTLEMTLDYGVVVPVTVTVAISYGVRKLFCRESIYTMKLARRGHLMPEALHSTVHNLRTAREIMDSRFITIGSIHSIRELASLLHNDASTHWIVVKEGGESGLLSREMALEAACSGDCSLPVSSLPSLPLISVPDSLRFYDIILGLRLVGARAALVVRGEPADGRDVVVGVIGDAQIARAVSQCAEFFPVLTSPHWKRHH